MRHVVMIQDGSDATGSDDTRMGWMLQIIRIQDGVDPTDNKDT